MPRYKLTVEYDGTPFHGWQRQANGLSVQECLERAIKRFCGDKVTLHAAGRTDAGVHALGQIVHADLSRDHPDPHGTERHQLPSPAGSHRGARCR